MTATDLHTFGANYLMARKHAERARLALQVAIREAAATGISEAEIARVTGVQRETVRKALGKG